MERWNSEGILREMLVVALKDRDMVLTARRVDTCMLCRRKKVNEAGICEVCYGSLDGPELTLAVRWRSGVGP